MIDEEPMASPPHGVRTTRRRGRTSAAKERALRELAPRWAPDPQRGAGRAILFDLGVGDGTATRCWAADRPDAIVFAIELHRPGLAKLLNALDAEGPPNVWVTEADAVAVVEAASPGSVAVVRVLFPDPWPKRRHVGRRIVDRDFVYSVARILVPGGQLHLATDWADYAEHMRSMVATDARFVLETDDDRPPRPVTAYEQRGIDAGRAITDLVYRRR